MTSPYCVCFMWHVHSTLIDPWMCLNLRDIGARVHRPDVMHIIIITIVYIRSNIHIRKQTNAFPCHIFFANSNTCNMDICDRRCVSLGRLFIQCLNNLDWILKPWHLLFLFLLQNGPLPLVFRVFQEANKRQKSNYVAEVAKESTRLRTDSDLSRPPVVASEPIANQERSRQATPPPPELDKEETFVEDSKNKNNLDETTTDLVEMSVLQSSNEDINKNDNGGHKEESLREVRKQTTEEEECLKANSLSNNNDNTEIITTNGQTKDHLPIDLKTGASSVDAPPTLTTVVPAR